MVVGIIILLFAWAAKGQCSYIGNMKIGEGDNARTFNT